LSAEVQVLASSERYKTAIVPMGSDSDKLERLRPVTFHLKTDPKGALQYGLIAEEVDKVYPELVIRDGAGLIQGVRYDELAPILLNEVQQQQRKMQSEIEKTFAQAQQIDAQAQQIDAQAMEIRDLKQQQCDTQRVLAQLQDTNKAMQIALREVQIKEGRVAMR
jgi:Chaperone of endosialidase